MRKFVIPYFVEFWSWTEELDEFPLARSVEELDDLMSKLIEYANDNYTKRYQIATSIQNPYSTCLWCVYFKFCTRASVALIKAHKIQKCNLYRLRMKTEDGNKVYYQGMLLTLDDKEVEENNRTEKSRAIRVR